MAFEGASFLLQWAAGGLLFLWVTTRRREVSLGYGWLMRGIYALFAIASAAVGLFVIDRIWVRDLASLGTAVAASVALWVSISRRKAGVSKQKELAEARSERVATMTGIDRAATARDEHADEFPPWLDLVAPVIGFAGIVGTGLVEGDPQWLAVARLVVGAAFLGAVSDGMLLGHWYLVQPGMTRGPLLEQVRWVGYLWLPEALLMVVPVGMISVINGTIDDGYGGLLGWFWLASTVTTIGLVIVTRLALRERAYSAVMAATGLLYLAILTAFSQDLVARALVSGH
jgi:hypothetical protein